jgi:hypothetical protein
MGPFELTLTLLTSSPVKEAAGSGQLSLKAFGGGKEIRTPDIQLAKLALYQLSYAPRSGGLPPLKRALSESK